MFSGAHFDEYIADYDYMKAGAIDEDVFRTPDLCDGQKIHKLSRPPAFPLRMAALLPAVRIGEAPPLQLILQEQGVVPFPQCTCNISWAPASTVTQELQGGYLTAIWAALGQF